MGITWLNAKEREGVASFYSTNITLNTVASVPFEYAYRVQVGIDDQIMLLFSHLAKIESRGETSMNMRFRK